MAKPGDYTKGELGHLLDLRKSMGQLEKTCNEWCRAFDVGDAAAIQDLSVIFGETVADIGKSLNENARIQKERLG